MTNKELLSLHRYFIWSNRLHLVFSQVFLQVKRDLKSNPDLLISSNVGTFMSYWYGSLFVVVEGYRELKLSDPIIDGLLSQAHVEFLRRYRNGTFHFKKKYYDNRFIEFISEGGSAKWTWELQSAFSDFFKKELAIDSDYQLEIDPRLYDLA